MNKTNNEIENINNQELEDQKNQAQWYVLTSNKGHEMRVIETLKQKIESRAALKYKVFNIKIIEETVIGKDKKPEIKNGYPGYIFIKMIMTDETWYDIRNTTGVTGFIGSSGKGIKPDPLPEKDATFLEYSNRKEVKKEQAPKKDKKDERDFNLNQYIHIISGALKGHEGQVSQLDDDKGVATVNIDFFGRSTPVKVEYVCCKKVATS